VEVNSLAQKRGLLATWSIAKGTKQGGRGERWPEDSDGKIVCCKGWGELGLGITAGDMREVIFKIKGNY